MVLIKPVDIFYIKVHDYNNNNSFLGYVKYNLVKDLIGTEYVLEQGSTDKNQALKFELYDYISPVGPSSIPNVVPVIKALLPGSTSGKQGPTKGDYIVYRGRGGEFNPLLYDTTEYRNADTWILAPPDAINTENWEPMKTDTFYSIFSIDKALSIIKLSLTVIFDLLSSIFLDPRLNVVQTRIRRKVHGRWTNPPQLAFGHQGNSDLITFSFELVEE